MSESRLVAVESLFKNILGLADVCLFRAIILCCHCRLVYDRFRKALAVERAVCWFSAVTGLFLAFLFFVFLAFVADLLVVAIDNILYIGHTTVA